VRIEAVDAEVKLSAEMVGGKWAITKLAADGIRHGEAEEILGGRVKLDARDGTMWYLIERR